MKKIFLSVPHVGEVEKQFLMEAFDSNWITPVGPMIDAFEKEFAEKVGVKYAAAVTSGTAALHLAAIILGIKTGDEVLTSTFTFCASVNPIVYQGAKPVFVDSDRKTWTISPDLIAEEIERRVKLNKLPKAVLIVDIYGQSVDYDPVIEICQKYEIPLIDDATESLGAKYKGKNVGSLCDISAFSFNGNKIITTSGGGMIVSNNESYIRQAKFLSTQAKDPYHYYHHTQIGYNYRMSNLLAALGRGQLQMLDERVKRRREINQFYRDHLGDLAGIELMPEPGYCESTFWLSALTINPKTFGASNEDVRLHLESCNIESRLLWKPMHQQPIFKDCQVIDGEVADELFATGLCLPSSTSLTDEELDYVVQSFLTTPRKSNK